MSNTKAFAFILGATLFSVLFTSCLEEEERVSPDIRTIQQYIDAKMLTDVQVDPNGLHYIIRDEGVQESAFPSDTSIVNMSYEGRLINDIIFDRRDSVDVDLLDVVTGFRQGVRKIREGGEIKLIIPPNLAYGSQARNLIPAGSILIFDIKLHSVVN